MHDSPCSRPVLHAACRSLDSVHSQLDDRDYELRSSRANGYWTSNGEGD